MMSLAHNKALHANANMCASTERHPVQSQHIKHRPRPAGTDIQRLGVFGGSGIDADQDDHTGQQTWLGKQMVWKILSV